MSIGTEADQNDMEGRYFLIQADMKGGANEDNRSPHAGHNVNQHCLSDGFGNPNCGPE